MKKLVLALGLLALGVPALAGSIDGYQCDNACPLAQQANDLRAVGSEAAPVSAVAREEIARTVVANLDRI